MSEYAHEESSPPRYDNEPNLQNSLDDSANNSIIGKVKSRVSSILPNRLSKWFSPSTKTQNDSLNGSIRGGNAALPTRRRRRIELEEENYEDDDDDHRYGEYKEKNYSYARKGPNLDRAVADDENEDDDDSQDSDDEYNDTSVKQTRRKLNVEHQPPAKRSRLNIEVIDSPIVTRHQPLLSSTPSVSETNLRNSGSNTSVSRYTYQRLPHLNLCDGLQNKKDPAFNFGQQKDYNSVAKMNTDIIDLISNSSYEHEDNYIESDVCSSSRTGISSRKSLNIPSSTATLSASERIYDTTTHLRRQPLSSAKIEISEPNTMSMPPRRTSTTIHELEDHVTADNEKKPYNVVDKRIAISESNANTYNGSVETTNNCSMNKRQKLINGTSLNAPASFEPNEGILVDSSASESGESAMEVIKTNSSNTKQNKTGLFNMSAGGSANTRNCSRTSSFGNGLNFYSHLEGRKSLFSGGSNHVSSNPLNSSTLSLTSLNRRQFNASIYGSTSALSDSRLLNTFSPFYKGKTTYGGAAAYNKYTAGAGASTVRITPTLIRPSSSLSTLSSSSNSLANNVNSQIGENSAISSTAKRILDLINDFATPLSEAKKMASNLKTNPNLHIPPQAKGRLNESDLNASRAIRLSQVRTPYSRSAVILQPSGNATSVRSNFCGLLPPIKELQVPTMSQLLQLKKMQNTTENARKIAKNSFSGYKLPDLEYSKNNTTKDFEQAQQKHTNKIKNKMTKSLRSSVAATALQDEEPPPTVNLPNISFPSMDSVPKIDIEIKKPSLKMAETKSECKSAKLTPINHSNIAKIDLCETNSFSNNISPIHYSKQSSDSQITDKKNEQLLPMQSIIDLKPSKTFKFSEPLQVVGVTLPLCTATSNEMATYKFSHPLNIPQEPSQNCSKLHNTETKNFALKEGSCLDVLRKPPTLPATFKSNVTDSSSSSKGSVLLSSGFGDHFKKSLDEWECEACMINNKSNTNKCVACETPRKQNSTAVQQSSNCKVSAVVTDSFGEQFQKPSSGWECDVCMIRNKEESTKCIACETQRKRGPVQGIKNSLGNAFKPKSDTWECPTCMISNKNENNECIACQTKKSGCINTTQSVVPPPQLKFGFPAMSKADAAFKTLAAQQNVSKWECDACMTRNDNNRTKCACCEQPKPGISTAEPTDESSNKFQFGVTSASKFSFGFGTGANSLKEADLRKELSSRIEPTAKSTTFDLGTSQTPSKLGFQFGNKTSNNTSDCKKDDKQDDNIQITRFKFGVSNNADELNVKDKPSDVISPVGFLCSSSDLTTSITTTITNTTSISTTPSSTNIASAKIPMSSETTSTSASNTDKSTAVTLSEFSFGKRSASATEGFFLGNKIEKENTVVTAEKEQRTVNTVTFKVPSTTTPIKSTGFSFGLSAINSSTAITTSYVSSTLTTTASTTTTSTTTATANPVFSFGSNTSTKIPLNSQTTPVFGTLSFGSNLTSNIAATTSSKALFAAVTSTTTTTANQATKISQSTSSTTTTPASTNMFSFGGVASSSNTSAPPIFGSSVSPPANNNNLSPVSSSTNIPTTSNTSQFGAFGSNTTNIFGSFGSSEAKSNALVKPNGTKPTLPLFGKISPISTSQSSQPSSFVFGSTTTNITTAATTGLTTGSVTSTSTTWPKSSFVFGSNTSATQPLINAPPVNSSENKEITKTVFGGAFGSCNANSSNQQNSSIFGVSTSNVVGTSSSALNATTSEPSNFSTNLFVTNSAPAVTSIFGANSSGNALTPAPTFGSSLFGGAASSSATPTFGSTAASSGTTFGSFGSSPSNTTSTIEVKKPEAAFNFGSSATKQSTSSGFNFGSSASTTKLAFNFGGTSTSQQPTFNFTGTAESQSSTKPFQFGATPPAPVFQFNRNVLEGSTNAPFQFNAGVAPVSSNIFAPAPTSGAQTAQQAKRKIRAPTRRVTQR